MPRYRVVRNRLTMAVIHINTYLTILGLIERELQRPDLDSNERIRLRSTHLEFQRFFYAGRSNGPQQYEEICRYVRDGKIPQNKDQKKLKKKFLAMCRRFRQKETALYQKMRTKEVKVLQRYQIIPLLYTLHEGSTGAHNGTERIFQQVQERYYQPKMYEDIRGYVQTCDTCQQRGNPKANNILHPIEPKAPFQRIGIDIVGPLTITKKGNRYIVTAMDYLPNDRQRKS